MGSPDITPEPVDDHDLFGPCRCCNWVAWSSVTTAPLPLLRRNVGRDEGAGVVGDGCRSAVEDRHPTLQPRPAPPRRRGWGSMGSASSQFDPLSYALPQLRRRPRAGAPRGTSRAPATPQPSSPPRQRRPSRSWPWAAATRRPGCLLLRHHGRPTTSCWKQDMELLQSPPNSMLLPLPYSSPISSLTTLFGQGRCLTWSRMVPTLLPSPSMIRMLL
ncbi:hypothetical protein MUK42_06953 [Musa troglodytarum]|uniref:Uncharacterized protein n=1 Tax=Musa troglodytarum TaxID=320322 RepID=A0A9E7KVW1_9LILI|nr:hypothetical protein MUK42_06953 [Musa troglodytarum]